MLYNYNYNGHTTAGNTAKISLITMRSPTFATRQDVLRLFFADCPTGRHACSYKLPGGGYDLWFPNLVKAETANDNHGWSNVTSPDGTELTEYNVDVSRHTYRAAPCDRIVFAHVAGVGYRFIGIFRPENNEDYKTAGYKYCRVSDRVVPGDFRE